MVIRVPDLRDDAVALRPWRESDLPAKLVAFNDPVVQRFSWRGGRARTPRPTRERTSPRTSAHWRHGTGAEFACVRAGRRRRDPRRGVGLRHRGRLGARLRRLLARARTRAGAGSPRAPCGCSPRWAFVDLGIERLQLTCGPDNAASQRVAERAGFTREGVLRSHLPFKGGRRDTVVFSLLPGELAIAANCGPGTT